MNTQDKYPDAPPCVESRELPEFYTRALVETATGANCGVLHLEVGPVTLAGRDLDNQPVGAPTQSVRDATALRNTKLTRPAEQYPGEAERMIAEMTRLATVSIQRARDATDPVRLLVELDEAAWFIAQARRWATP